MTISSVRARVNELKKNQRKSYYLIKAQKLEESGFLTSKAKKKLYLGKNDYVLRPKKEVITYTNINTYISLCKT